MRTIVLISCASKKANAATTAEQLYTSPLFKKNLAHAKKLNPDAIYILSAKHYLLPLDKVIEPYDQRVSNKKAENKALKELKDEVEILKKQKQAIPIGLIAIWGKPANEIPEGWREYTDLRGRMPVGLDPYYHKTNDDAQDYQLNSLLKQGGERSHKLTEAEMPSHSHKLHYRETQDDAGNGSDGRELSTGTSHSTDVTKTGGDQPHNNMPPYHVVQFIEYIGFN